MRIALGVEYDGSQFYGWQQQTQLRTVQGCLEQAISQVANHAVSIICAGRTDTGVHAFGQVIHFDTTAERSDRSWVFGVNSLVPKDVSVRWAKVVPSDFHARFSAIAREYCYIIYNQPIRPALQRQLLTWECRALDEKRMQQAAAYLVGEHDFSSYRAKECQAKTAIRRIAHLNVCRKGERIIISVKANAFLQHMVRNIVGVLLAIGTGDNEPYWAKEVLEARDRNLGGVTAKASGLFLSDVDYPAQYSVPVSINNYL